MKRLPLLLALMLVSALPAVAQTHEFGVLVGGSRRFVEDAPRDQDGDFLDSNFSFGNNVVDLYWAMALEPDVYFKLRGGRIETPVAYVSRVDGENRVRKDAEGEVQHVDATVEYRFPEVWGRSALFGGVGMYRHSTDESDATTSWGFVGGVNADFPMTPRYGLVIEGAYHWTQADYKPRYLTLTGGLRISF